MRWTRTITVVDCHAEGESGQVIVAGMPPVPGDTVFDKRVFLQDQADDLRRMILFEPRGAPHHNANLPMSEPTTQLTLASPAGLISVVCNCRDGKVERVRFVNQPAFCYHLDAEIDVPDLGRLTVDVAFGGMTYVLVDAARVGFELIPAEARHI